MEFSISNESCRVCLRKTPTGRHIIEPAKGEEHGEKRTLMDLYHLCTGYNDPSWLQSETHSFYPRKICAVCEQLLLAAYELRRQCTKSEKVLQNILHFYEDDDAFCILEETVQEEIQNTQPDERMNEYEELPGKADDSGLELLQEAALLIAEECQTNTEEPCEKSTTVQEESFEKQTEAELGFTEEPECYAHIDHPIVISMSEDVSEEVMLEEYTVEATVEASNDIELIADEDNDEEVRIFRDSKDPSTPNCTYCPDCGKLVSSRYLTKHRYTHLGTQRYECDICKIRFTFQENLTKHKRIHQNDKRYKCLHCHEVFLHWASRRYHIERVHTKEKRFACEYCGAKFRQSSHYQIHLRRHTGTAPYACSICNRTFITKYSLKEHMLSHSDKKEFSCIHCWKQYKTVKSLRVHLKTHNEAKRYICSVCEKTFTQNHSLRTHHMKTHPEFELPPPGTTASIKT